MASKKSLKPKEIYFILFWYFADKSFDFDVTDLIIYFSKF